MAVGRQYLVFLLLLFVVSMCCYSTIPTEAQLADTGQQPIKFWRDDFQVNSSYIFPMITFGFDNSLSNLGRAWITWTIDTEGGQFAAIAIYHRGQISNFTVLEGIYEEISYFAVEDQLVAVTSTATTSVVYFFSDGNPRPISQSLQVNSSNHELFISDSLILGFARLNNSRSAYLIPTQFGLVESPTREVMLDSAPGMAIIRNTSGDKLIFQGTSNQSIPDHLSNNLRIGHYLLSPVIFDLDNAVAWGPTLGNVSLPAQVKHVQFFGLQSSLLVDTDNNIWQLTPMGFSQVAASNYAIESVAIVDINLYIGTTHQKGVDLLAFGEDEDGDYLPNTMEDYFGSLPSDPDTDGDGISDQIEVASLTNPRINDLDRDYDNDGLTTGEEYTLGTDPTDADTDFGGANDGWEVLYDYDPFDRDDDGLDEDSDGATNALESEWNSDPRNSDTDGDGMDDFWEIKFRLQPVNASDATLDPDNDGRENLEEYRRGSDPLYADNRPIFDGLWVFVLPIIILGIVMSRFTIKRMDLV